MKLFRMMIVFLYFTMGLDMDMFVVGQDCILPSIKMEEEEYCSREDSKNIAIPFRPLEKDVCPLIENVLSEETFEFPLHCSIKCLQDPFCAGYNFKSKRKKNNCQFTHTLHHNFHDCKADDKGWIFYHPVAPRKIPCRKMKNCKNGEKTIIYLKDGPGSNPYRCACAHGYGGDLCEIGSSSGSKSFPGKSCKDILTRKTIAVSGIYWIKLASNKLFQVFCDMETHGGGWTLVYSYTFTNYNSFTSASNAVTPRPNWPASNANVSISTTPPLRESSLGAVDWNVWKDIGKEFMVKSNINDWIVCQPSGGSIVTKKQGSLSCRNIKNVATTCNGVAPYKIRWYSYGPVLDAFSLYYYFDGRTLGDWPTHDPCGKGNQNHKKGVSNPGGQIYLR